MQKDDYDAYVISKGNSVVSKDVKKTYKIADPFFMPANLCPEVRNSEGMTFKEKVCFKYTTPLYPLYYFLFIIKDKR
jgi:hypothetical protein